MTLVSVSSYARQTCQTTHRWQCMQFSWYSQCLNRAHSRSKDASLSLSTRSTGNFTSGVPYLSLSKKCRTSQTLLHFILSIWSTVIKGKKCYIVADLWWQYKTINIAIVFCWKYIEMCNEMTVHVYCRRYDHIAHKEFASSKHYIVQLNVKHQCKSIPILWYVPHCLTKSAITSKLAHMYLYVEWQGSPIFLSML